MRKSISSHKILIISCITLFSVITCIKLLLLDYRPDQVIPQEGWLVTISMEGIGAGENVSFTHFLSPTEPGQQIEGEKFNGDFNRYSTELQDGNNMVSYSFHQPLGKITASCSFTAIPQEITYMLPDSAPLIPDPDNLIREYLKPEPLIQTEAPEIAQKAVDLGLTETENSIRIIRNIFNYCHDSIQNARFSGETDAVLACRLGEASCNGKSRLMVALCRHMGIPARLVGGLILQGKEKKATHQWVEAYINDKWVTFCPLNGYFGKKPVSYITAYRGDYAFFRHTKNIKFDYKFTL
jgi:transglutaminase-like putative cysteine protease